MALFFIFSVLGNTFDNDLNVPGVCKSDSYFPKVIWTSWDSDNIPEDVQEMVKVTRNSLVNFTFCLVIVDRNLSHFLDFSSFPKNYRDFTVNRMSDVIRVRLLGKYGGLYIDASTYINSGIEMEWFFTEAVRSKGQLVGFVIDNNVVLTNFIAAPKDSAVIRLIQEEHDFALLSSSNYVRRCLLLKEKDMGITTDYELFALTIWKVMRDHEIYNRTLTILPRNRSHIGLLSECKWEKGCIQKAIRDGSFRRKYPFTKVLHLHRAFASKTKVLPSQNVKKQKKKKKITQLKTRYPCTASTCALSRGGR